MVKMIQSTSSWTSSSNIVIILLLSMLAVSALGASLVSQTSEQETQSLSKPRHLQKKSSFSSIGCLGTYDRAKFARLDRVCDECFQIYRDADLHNSCREFCFKNDVFPACVDALLLSHEVTELNGIVDQMLG